MTRWSPDTCGCEIEYDDNINVVAVHRKCDKHAGIVGDAVHLATVLAHNRKKNAVHNAVLDHLKTKKSSVAAEMVATFYDANDNLHIAGSGLNAGEQQTIMSEVGTALGTSSLNFLS